MAEKQENLQSTAGFISYKCKRDHINSQLLASITKSTSQYKSQYRRDNTISPFEEKSKMIGKTRNSPVKNVPTSIVTPLSQYNHSYHNQSPVKKPTLHHEGPTFFLKQQKIDQMTTSYNDMSLEKKKGQKSMYERGKARCDNLGVAKYNRMTSKSMYRDSFVVPIKLPLIKLDKKQSKIQDGKNRKRANKMI